MTGSKPWIITMAKEMVSPVSSGAAATVGDDADWPVFLNSIQPGKKRRINSKEPGQAVIGLIALRKLASVEVWLFMKYDGQVFLDKDADGEGGDAPSPDEGSWEEQEIFDGTWVKSKGWGVNMKLFDTGDMVEEEQPYAINAVLHTMI